MSRWKARMTVLQCTLGILIDEMLVSQDTTAEFFVVDDALFSAYKYRGTAYARLAEAHAQLGHGEKSALYARRSLMQYHLADAIALKRGWRPAVRYASK